MDLFDSLTWGPVVLAGWFLLAVLATTVWVALALAAERRGAETRLRPRPGGRASGAWRPYR